MIKEKLILRLSSSSPFSKFQIHQNDDVWYFNCISKQRMIRKYEFIHWRIVNDWYPSVKNSACRKTESNFEIQQRRRFDEYLHFYHFKQFLYLQIKNIKFKISRQAGLFFWNWIILSNLQSWLFWVFSLLKNQEFVCQWKSFFFFFEEWNCWICCSSR